MKSGDFFSHRRRGLVIDDEADIRDAMVILLTWAGYEVQSASDSSSAMRAAAAYLPHLVLLDIGMPGVDGYSICRALRAIPELADTRIYALSGFSGPQHDARCVQAGFNGAYTKPIDLDVLRKLAAS